MGCHSALFTVTTEQKNNEPDPLKHDLDYPCVFATSGWESPLNLLIQKVRQRDGVPDVWGIQVWLTKDDLIELYNESDEEDREELKFVFNMNENEAILAESG